MESSRGTARHVSLVASVDYSVSCDSLVHSNFKLGIAIISCLRIFEVELVGIPERAIIR